MTLRPQVLLALLAAFPVSVVAIEAAVDPGMLRSSQDDLAPPRGFFGPGPGDAGSGGPGDRGDVLSTDSASWIRWWTFNRERLLLRDQLGDEAFAPVALGARAGGPAPPAAFARPTDRIVYQEIVPSIIARLERTKDLDIKRASLLALAKIGTVPAAFRDPDLEPDVGARIEGFLKDRNQSVSDAAVIALGILGDARQVALLNSIATDDRTGRKAMGKTGALDRRSRAFAIYALGAIGRRQNMGLFRAMVAGHLKAIAEAERSDAHLATAAILCLGHCPLPPTTALAAVVPGGGAGPAPARKAEWLRTDMVDCLESLHESRVTDNRARTFIPVAMARLALWPGDGGAADAKLLLGLQDRVLDLLTKELGKRSSGAMGAIHREALIEAVGLLATCADGKRHGLARALLAETMKSGQEREAGLAAIALARIAARGPIPAGDVTLGIRGELGTNCVEGKPSLRPWTLFALGLLEGERLARGAAPALGTQALLESRLGAASTPEERAAAAVSLGLSRNKDAAPVILKRTGEGDFRIRGLHAMALALMGQTDAVPAMREIIASGVYRPYLERDVATALALLGDVQLAGTLSSKLYSARFMPQKVAALQALAWCRDRGAIAPLLEVVNSARVGRSRVDDTTRAFAIAALGALAAKDQIPWNAPFAESIPWPAAPSSLTDPERGGGVLDLF